MSAAENPTFKHQSIMKAELIQYIKGEITRNIDIADQYVTDECSSLRDYDYCASVAVVNALQEVLKRLESAADQPAPVQTPPIPNVLILVEGGIVEVGIDMPVNLFIMDLDIMDEENEPSEQEKQFFNLVWDRLPEHRNVDDNGSIYDFAQVGL